MRFYRQLRVSFTIAVVLMLLTVLGFSFATLAADEVVLYREDFESGRADEWALDSGWDVVQETSGNWVLRGQGHQWASYLGDRWGDHTFKLRVKLVKDRLHINYRLGDCIRYFIAFGERGLDILKTQPCGTAKQLKHSDANHRRGRWYEVKIVGKGGTLKVYVDGRLRVSCTDPDPLLFGSIALETLEGCEVLVDDIEVLGHDASAGLSWVRTGGPLGGLGYDIRMRPDNPDIMYVTDAFAGVHMSTDGGRTWFPSNSGITARAGLSGDIIPVFSLTIDPHDHDILWLGTDVVGGIYKSTDAGRTWREMDNGVVEEGGITFRGFTVDPRTSDTVYAAAEVHSWIWIAEYRDGCEFELTKGVVYKTIDGGQSWNAIWRGNHLARYIWIDPRDPDVLYVSTGFMDREAANSNPQALDPGGVGVIKSTDGGRTWREINVGLENKYAGSLFMHPENPDILIAGTGSEAGGGCLEAHREGNGIYLSTDGGATWRRRMIGLYGENITAVEISQSDPNIAYAGGLIAVYRSDDGGRKWRAVSGGSGTTWGPPGVCGGFPVDIQVDPQDPDRLFINNYGGGNFLSTDGGRTWANASEGYTGAQVRDIAVDTTNPSRVIATARSGVFISDGGGEDWAGYTPFSTLGWDVIAINPLDSQHMLTASTSNAIDTLFLTRNGGRSWSYVGPRLGEDKAWRTLAFSLSNPNIIYAGSSAFITEAVWENGMPARGIYVSHDGGEKWQSANDALSSNANISALSVSPTDADIVYAATGTHRLLKTTDGGRNWMTINGGLPKDPVALSIACHPTDPQIIFAGLARAGVYRSTDGGTSWRPSSAGMNPEAVVSDIVFDPTNPTVLFATDRMTGVYRSTNGGTTWHAINQGLRMREVNALAISSDGQVLYAATEGEGVYRLDLTGLQGTREDISATPTGDRDGDGVPDEDDYCPDHPGSKEANGC